MIKLCIKCKTMKPLNLFTKDKLSRGGRKNECSACLSERRRIKYRKNNIEAILKREETLRREAVAKMCRKCKTVKPLSSFAKEKRARNGRLNECSECCNKRKRGYRKNNIEKVLKREAAWRIKNRDKENKKNREWKERNPEKVKAMRHEWEKKNPEYMKNWLKSPKRKLGNSILWAKDNISKGAKLKKHFQPSLAFN